MFCRSSTIRTLSICTLLAGASAITPFLHREIKYDVDAKGHLSVHRHHTEKQHSKHENIAFHQSSGNQNAWEDENNWENSNTWELLQNKDTSESKGGHDRLLRTEKQMIIKDKAEKESERDSINQLGENTKDVYVFLTPKGMDEKKAPRQVLVDLGKYNLTYESFTHESSWAPPAGALVMPEQELVGIEWTDRHKKEIKEYVSKGGKLILAASHSDQGDSPGIRLINTAFGFWLSATTHPARHGIVLNRPPQCGTFCGFHGYIPRRGPCKDSKYVGNAK